MARKRGLGRGLSALIPDDPDEDMIEENQEAQKEKASNNKKDISAAAQAKKEKQAGEKSKRNNAVPSDISPDNETGTKETSDLPAAGENEIVTLRLSKVEPDPSQPRKNFTQEELEQLAASIKEHGLLQPIIVTPEENTDRYLIVAGERRWRACQIAGIPTIQVIIKTFDSRQDQLEASLIENIQREDLNPIEEANAYQRLMDEFHLTQEEVAEKVSRSRAAVANSLRLLRLDPEVQQMVVDGKLSMGHARALLPVEDKAQQKELAEEIVTDGRSVRDVEKLIKNLGKTHKHVSRETDPSLAAIYKDVQNRMQQSLGMNVKVSYKNDKSGKVEIAFANDDDLEKLMSLFF